MRAFIIVVLLLLIAGCTRAPADCTNHKNGEKWVEVGKHCTCDDGQTACTQDQFERNVCKVDSDCMAYSSCPSVARCEKGSCVARCISPEEYTRAKLFEVLGCNDSMTVPPDSPVIVGQEMDGPILVVTSYINASCSSNNSLGYSEMFRNSVDLFYQMSSSNCSCPQKVIHRVTTVSDNATQILTYPLYWATGKTNLACDTYTPCFAGMDCILYPGALNGVCVKPPYCEGFPCPEGKSCHMTGNIASCG